MVFFRQYHLQKKTTFFMIVVRQEKIMTINEFLEQTGICKRDFAKILGCNYTHLVAVSNGKKKAGVKLAKKIEEKTMGLVKKEKIIFG